MKLLDDLREKRSQLLTSRKALISTMETIAKSAERANRSLTATETLQFDEARSKVDAIDAQLGADDGTTEGTFNERIAELEAIDERTRAAGRSDVFGAATRRPSGSETRERALDLIERLDRDQAAALDHDAAERATRLVERDGNGDDPVAQWVLTVGAPAYRAAFGALLRDPQNGHRSWTPEQLEAFQRAERLQRALSTATTGNNGGYLLPLNLDPMIMISSGGVIDPIRAIARNVTITAGDKWDGISSTGVTAEWHTELSEVADATPTLAQPAIPVWTADAFVPFSVEMADEADLAQQLRRLMADAKRNLEAAAWINGNGTSAPKGIATALASGSSIVSPATAETFAAADVYSTLEALPPRFRANARWAAELSTLNSIDKFETTNGAKMFPSISETPPTLLRRPVAEVSSLDPASGINAAATADNNILLVGDFEHYVIVDRLGTTVELVPHLLGSNGRPNLQRGLVMFWRVGADVTVSNAFRLLDVVTTA